MLGLGSKMRVGGDICERTLLFAFLFLESTLETNVNCGGQECPPYTVIVLRDGALSILGLVGGCRGIAGWDGVGRVARMVDVIAKFRAEFAEPRLVLGYGENAQH
jgi:hypothetical protein